MKKSYGSRINTHKLKDSNVRSEFLEQKSQRLEEISMQGTNDGWNKMKYTIKEIAKAICEIKT